MNTLSLIPVGIIIGLSLVYFLFFRFLLNTCIHFFKSVSGSVAAFLTIEICIVPAIAIATHFINVYELRTKGLTWGEMPSLVFISIMLPTFAVMHIIWIRRSEDLERRIEVQEVEHAKELKTLNLNIEEVECQRNFMLSLDEGYHAVVGQKTDDLKKILGRTGSHDPTIQEVVDPEQQINRYVVSVRNAYRELACRLAHDNDVNVRVALFREDIVNEEAVLVPIFSNDGRNNNWLKLSSDELENFRLESEIRSAAVYAAVHNAVRIVPDAAAENETSDSPFRYFGDIEGQAAQIKSLIAIPISDVSEDSDRRRIVIVMDADHPNAFLEEHRWKAIKVKRQMEARVGLLKTLQQFV